MKTSDFISFDTLSTGIIYIKPEDISLITLPHWYHYVTFNGYGSLITLKNGKTLHIKEDLHEVIRIVKEALEE